MKQIIINETPDVSVCIAVFNGEKTIRKTIESILQQRGCRFEILIADGKSTDNTVKIINEYEEKITWFQSNADNGVYDAWNKILTQATGKWICFLGADDHLIDEDTISGYLAAAEKITPRCRLIYSKVKYFDSNDIFQFEQGSPWEEARIKLPYKMTIPHVGMLQHRSIFDEGFAFNARYKISGDFDLVRQEAQKNGAYFWDRYTVHAQTGGLSTHPKNELKHIMEEGSIIWHQSNTIPVKWIISFLKISLRSLIYKTFGEHGLRNYEKLKKYIQVNKDG